MSENLRNPKKSENLRKIENLTKNRQVEGVNLEPQVHPDFSQAFPGYAGVRIGIAEEVS